MRGDAGGEKVKQETPKDALGRKHTFTGGSADRIGAAFEPSNSNRTDMPILDF